jgi:hypothetical protein
VSKQQRNRNKQVEQQARPSTQPASEEVPAVEGTTGTPEVLPDDAPVAEEEGTEQSQAPEQTDTSATSTSDASESGTTEVASTAGKKRGRKRGRLVNAEDVMPRPSLWPIALAFSLVVLLLGIMLHPLVIVLGALMVLGSIIGWNLERR